MKKIIISVIVTVILMTCYIPYCYSADNGLDGAMSDGKEFLNHASESPIKAEALRDFSNSMSNTLLLVGMIIAVIVGIILGIKLMLSSVEEKAKVKEMLTIYVVGCVVLFGAFTIWKLCVGIFQDI